MKPKIKFNPAPTPILDSYDNKKNGGAEFIKQYGKPCLTLDQYLNNVLLRMYRSPIDKGRSNVLDALQREVEYGLVGIFYDKKQQLVDSGIKKLLSKIRERRKECRIDADDLEFWKTLKNERKYFVKIDDVALTSYLMGHNYFCWYNEHSAKTIELKTPVQIKKYANNLFHSKYKHTVK